MSTGLQARNITQVIGGGYEGENPGISGGYNRWTDIALNGSVEVEYYYRDSEVMSNANSTTVFVKILDSWTTVYDSDARSFTITVTSSVTGITRKNLVGSPGNGHRNIKIYDDRNGNLIWSKLNDAINNNHTILSSPVVLSTRTYTLTPQTENGKGTIFYRNESVGHESDPDAGSIYVDTFYMGTQFRNNLPDAPNAPTIGNITSTAVDCQTLTVSVPITQNSWGEYATEEAYARYKIGNGSWSSYSKVTGSHTGTYLIQNVTPASTVTIEAYSTGDGSNSTSATATYTTPSRPSNPTVSFVSQTAESSQTSLRASLSYSVSNGDDYGTLIVSARYKVGDAGWTEWANVGATKNGSFNLTNLTPDRTVLVQVRSNGDGLCSAGSGQTTFTTPRPIDAPVLTAFTQTDTGSCINVSLPWTQPDNIRFSSGTTYYSYQINNGNWSDWTSTSSWTAGTDTVTCVPYDGTICIRSYSVGDGLKGRTSRTCITVSSKASPDDTPYSGEVLTNVNLCESMFYLATLICQEWYAIKDDERTIYTNEEHKEACHGDEDDPTLHSMLSRIYRFFGAMVCLICSGLDDDFNYFKNGDSGTILQSDGDGAYGEWVTPDDAVTEDSTAPVTSGAIYDAIDEYIHTTFYYVGEWTYLTLNPTTLANVADPKNGDIALVKNGVDGTNQTYIYNGSNWTAGELNSLDPFDFVHVEKDSTWTYGGQTVQIDAGSAWFWYNSNWNAMDARSSEIQTTLDHLLATNMVMKQDASEEDMQVALLSRNANGTVSTPATPATKTIYFVTEEI